MDVSSLQHNTRLVDRYMIGFIGLVFWDGLATSASEYRLIWKSAPWTPTKIAYLFNKYWTLLGNFAVLLMVYTSVTVATCDRIYWILLLAITGTIAACDVIVGIRVWSAYERQKNVLVLLIAVFAGELTCMIYVSTRLVPVVFPSSLATAIDYYGCTAGNPAHHEKFTSLLYWCPSIFYNLLCLLLLIGRHIYLVHVYHSMDLLDRLTRDGVIYFLVIVGVDIPTIYFCAQSDPGLTTLNVCTSTSIKSLMATRLVLGLRERAQTSSAVRTLSPRMQTRKETEQEKPVWIPPHLLHSPTYVRAVPFSA